MPTRATGQDGITSSPLQKMTEGHILWAIASLGVGSKFVRCSFDNYDGGSKNAVMIAAGKKPLPWMYLFGQTGSGKTHLAVAVIRYLIESGRASLDKIKTSVAFANVPEMLFEIRHTYDSGKFGETEWSHMQQYNLATLLILDDLGAERTNDWATDIIYRIIANRDKNERTTITTSNFSPAEIEKIHGAPVASRICQGAVIKIDTNDYRKKR